MTLPPNKPVLWFGIAVLVICLLAGAIYFVKTKDARADARMERQIGPLPEK